MFKKPLYLALFVLINLVFLLTAYEGQTQGVISLPWTGQTKCYDTSGTEISCAGTGQDGELQVGVDWPNPRFAPSGDCVTDNLTGLMWAKDANLPNGTRTWLGALDYVASMNAGSGLCGYKDWRLPNVNELESLVNAGEANSATWLNTQGFSNVQVGSYWSSTTMAYYTDYAWAGHVWKGEVTPYPKSSSNYVWPVRSGQANSPDPSYPANIWQTGQKTTYATGDDGDLEKGVFWPVPRFTDHGDGTITDNLTGLMWTKNANLAGGTKTWQGALDYVKTLNTGGYSDWRLPSRKELFSLIDHSKYDPALPIDHLFQNVQSSVYWSSTSSALFTNAACNVNMRSPFVDINSGKYSSYYVWPVRSGYKEQTQGVITLPQTGQTKCYDSAGNAINCAGTGQDGEYRAGVGWPNPRFTASGDCVTDNLTGLMWTKNANLPGGMRMWQEAMDYVASMNAGSGLCGYKDWRLPNVNELESLVNTGEANPFTWLNNQGFSNVSEEYWSSTAVSYEPVLKWVVVMWNGLVVPYIPDGYFYVWPVRSGQMNNSDPLYPGNIWKTGQKTTYASGDDGDLERGVAWPSPRFTDHGDGTVTDNLTGLMWTKNANLAGSTTWQEALDYVKTLSTGGYSDWRLPNLQELFSLIDFSAHDPALPSGNPFINVLLNNDTFHQTSYWSSTTYSLDPEKAWLLNIHFGELTPYYDYPSSVKGTHRLAWPVRGGQFISPCPVLNLPPGKDYEHGGTAQVPGIPYDIFNKIDWNWRHKDGSFSPLWSGNVTQDGSNIVLTVKDRCGVGAEIDSAGQEYGYAEYRATLKTVPGTKPPVGVCQAFFYYLTDTSEIDAEILSADPNYVHFSVQKVKYFRVPVPNQADRPHLYGFRWSLGRVEFLLDGKKAQGEEVDENWNPSHPNSGITKTAEVISPNVPTKKGQLMLSNWTGNVWAGDRPHGIGDQNMTILNVSIYNPLYVNKSGQCADRSPCFSTIQDAVDSAQVATIISLIQQTYYENVLLDNPNVIFIQGGWDAAFSNYESYTIINGSITITHGTLIVENIILQ